MTAQQVPFCRTEITPEAQQAAVRVLASGWVTTGAESIAFEQEFARVGRRPVRGRGQFVHRGHPARAARRWTCRLARRS